jgi:hypothetical protein
VRKNKRSNLMKKVLQILFSTFSPWIAYEQKEKSLGQPKVVLRLFKKNLKDMPFHKINKLVNADVLLFELQSISHFYPAFTFLNDFIMY